MSNERNYVEIIENLHNEIQEKAILHMGNSALLACPGAGKTKTVILKAAYLIKEVIKEPRGLACITFSNNAANEFKDRFWELNIQESHRVFFGTIHSFCLSKIVIPFGMLFLKDLINESTEIANEEQKKQCMLQSLDNNKINELPDHWFFPIRNIRKILHNNPDLIKSKKDKVIKVALDYESNLRKRNLIDFDDIIFISLDLINNHKLVRKVLCSKYPWLIVDEYQDLGEHMHKIISALIDTKEMNIFAVGDPHQSIHGYAGSNPKYLVELSQRSDVTSFDLVYNYRCCQPIIDASIDILKVQNIKKYISKREDSERGRIYYQECKSGPDEQIQIIYKFIIPQLQKSQVKLGDIAILFRYKKNLYYFDKKLRELGIPTLVVKESEYEYTSLTHWIEELAKWCAGGWKVGNPTFNELFVYWFNFIEIVNKSIKNRYYLKEKNIFYKKLQILKEKDYFLREWITKFKELFEIDKILNPNANLFPNIIRDLKSLNQLIKIILETDFGLQRLSQYKGRELTKDKILLMSLHGSKGLQFDSIIMPMLEDGILPTWGDSNIDEARRLFYVGITRAKNEVYLLWSGYNEDKWGRIHKNGPSRFAIELINNNRCNSL